jgi:hypothetical protein
MATTTNYGWTTPDDTALVKDGAAAIRTLGSSVDTTTKNLNPETTLGDLAYRSSTANVKTRLGLGTAGQVLQVNSGANAPEWATFAGGGLTLISTTSLTGATVNLTSIPGTYKHLQLILAEVYANADIDLQMRLNNDSTATAYDDSRLFADAGVGAASTGSARDNIRVASLKGASTRVNRMFIVIDFPRYTDTGQNQMVNSLGRLKADTAGYVGIGASYYGGRTAAITQINLIASGGTFSAGTAYLYGVS